MLDEWQAVPEVLEVLGTVKRAVDDDPRPGRFLLTWSVRGELEAEVWPGTGRLVRLAMYGLIPRETLGRSLSEAFMEKLVQGGLDAFELRTGPRPDSNRGHHDFQSGGPSR